MAFLAGFFGDGEQRLPYQPLPMPQRFLQPVPVNEAQTNEAYRTILAQKQGWENANKAATWWTKQLETPDLTDEQKQVINTNIEGWTQARDDFAKDAQRSRDLATSLGIDVSNYGEGKSLQDANRSYANFRNTAVRDFLNLPTVREQEENRYLELRNKGASPSMARSIIRDEREGRQEKFLQQMGNGIMTYGRDPDGSLNEVGLQMAQRINPASPETAMALFVGSLPNIKDAFTAKNTRDLAILGNTAAAERLAAQIDANYRNAEAQRRATRENLEYTVENANARQDKEFDFRKSLAEYQAQVKGLGGDGDKMTRELQFLTQVLGDPQKAAEVYIRQNYSKAFESLGKEDETLKDKKKFGNFVGTQFAAIEHFLKTGDNKTAQELIGQFRASINNPENKYAEIAGLEDTQALLEKLQFYDEVATGKRTLKQLRELEAGIAGDGSAADFRRLEEFNEKEGYNKEGKQIGYDEAIKQRQQRDMTGAFWKGPPVQSYSGGNSLYGYGPPNFFTYLYR